MGKLQRIGVIIVSIALIIACAFQLLEFSTVPFIMSISEYLHSLFWFSIVATIMLIVVMLGAIALLIYAIKAPSNTTHLVIKRDGGNVDVSTTAIKSVIRHVIARHSLIKLESIKIHVKHANNPALRIKVKINPGRQVQLDELGLALQEEIADTVEKFCGGIVESVNVVFTSADNSAVGSGSSSFGSSSSKFTQTNNSTSVSKTNSVATITVEDVKPPATTQETKPSLPSPKTAETAEPAPEVTYEVDDETPPSTPANNTASTTVSTTSEASEPTFGSKVSTFFKRTFGTRDSNDTTDSPTD